MEDSQLPDPPERGYDLLHSLLPHIGPYHREPGQVSVHQNSDRIRVSVDYGHLQPSRRAWSEVFYLAVNESGTIPLPGRIYASNSAWACEFQLCLTVTVARTAISVEELLSMTEPEDWPDWTG